MEKKVFFIGQEKKVGAHNWSPVSQSEGGKETFHLWSKVGKKGFFFREPKKIGVFFLAQSFIFGKIQAKIITEMEKST